MREFNNFYYSQKDCLFSSIFHRKFEDYSPKSSFADMYIFGGVTNALFEGSQDLSGSQVRKHQELDRAKTSPRNV